MAIRALMPAISPYGPQPITQIVTIVELNVVISVANDEVPCKTRFIMKSIKCIYTSYRLALVSSLIGLALLPSLTRASIQAQLYVDPVSGADTNSGYYTYSAFKTISRAKTEVATINSSMTGDIVVNLMNGTFYLPTTLTFGNSDSGTNGNNVIYQAYTGAAPVISGGEDISTGWSYDSTNNRYYKTGVTGPFRQLYVNGKWATRARTPNLVDDRTGGGYYKAVNTSGNPYPPFYVNTADVGNWAVGAEIVWISHWSQNRRRITSYSANGGTATLTLDSSQNGTDLNHHSQYPVYYYIENSLAALDVPGEWYYDSSLNGGTLYYKPRPGETMGSVSIVVPRREVLVDISGASPTSRVHNIQFRGLTFSHDNWTQPDTDGYVAGQGGQLIQTTAGTIAAVTARFSPTSAMLTVKNADHIVVERNVFTLGGSWGIMEFADSQTGTSSQYNTYNGNTFTQLASGAIVLGNQTDSDKIWAGDIPIGTGFHDSVTNNVIDRVSCYYRDAVGILALRVKNATIQNNVVRNLPYTGISLGWQWNASGQQDAHDNYVRQNRISSSMQLLDDGGGIYNLGKGPSSMQGTGVIDQNYIRGILPSVYYGGFEIAGMYLDEGSQYEQVQYNVGQSSMWFTKTNFASGTVHDNDGYYNYWRGDVGDTTGYNWSGNVDNTTTDWDPIAVGKINGAGLLPSFGDMDPEPTTFARWRFNQESSSATDTSLNGNNVTLYNGASYDVSDKKEGSASLSLNGTSQYARGSYVTTATSNVTMAAWVKWNGGSGAQIVAYNGYAGGNGFGMYLDSGTFKVLCGGVGYVVSSTTLSTGQWTHLAAVNKAGTWSLYVNGSPVSIVSGATTVPASATSGYTTIGWDGGSLYFNGRIDDVRLYSGPLSPAAVAAIAAGSGSERNEAQWGFNIGLSSGGDGSDGSGQGHTAIFYGSPTFDTSDHEEGSASLSLNGTSQYAYASLATTATSNVVMSAWVKWNGGSGLQFIMHNGGSGSSGYGMYLDNGVFKVLCGGVGYVVSSYTVPTGQWINLAAANADGIWSLYVNGLPIGVTSGSTTVPNTPAGLTSIGKDSGGGTSYFNGRIDDVRIYNTR